MLEDYSDSEWRKFFAGFYCMPDTLKVEVLKKFNLRDNYLVDLLKNTYTQEMYEKKRK